MRRFFLVLHRWLGLTIGLIIAWLGVTGSSLIFRNELEAKLYPELFRVQPHGQALSYGTVTAGVAKKYPNHKISLIFTAQAPEDTHEFWLDKGKLLVYVNPHNGQILGQRFEGEGVFNWLANGHIHLFYGETGEKVTGWCGVTLFALSLSGLILWFPRRASGWKRAFKPNLRTNWKGRIYELHRAGGFWVCGLLALSSLCGIALVWPDTATLLLSRVMAVEPPAKVKATSGKILPLDTLLANANTAFPEGTLVRLTFPAKAGAPFVVRKRLPGELHPNGMNNISVDPVTGRVLRVDDSRQAGPVQRLMNLRYPIHIGVWGGNFTRMLYVLLGWTPALLGISGFLMWRRRVQAHRQAMMRKP
jgi:uncharacterized iron-regulated membrane protein